MAYHAFQRSASMPTPTVYDFSKEMPKELREPMDAYIPSSLSKFHENKSSLTKHRDTYPFIDPYRFRNKLIGKVVLITKAHRGIGKATAVAFAQAGASVCCVGPTAQSLEAVLLEIKEKWNTPTLALAANMVGPEAPAQLVALVEKHRGPVDILINVTATGYLRPFAQEPNIMQDWWPNMETSVRLPISLIHAVLPSMISRGSGVIISTTLCSSIELPFLSGEGVAKAALIKFHQQLDLETRPKGILSFAVNPGPVPSHIHDPTTVSRQQTPLGGEIDMQSKMASLASEMEWAAAGLASGTFLALCADERTRVLSGLYVNAERDLEEVVTRMEKDKGRKVERDRLYRLKIDEY